jgi:SAM-dependent methyltransferase
MFGSGAEAQARLQGMLEQRWANTPYENRTSYTLSRVPEPVQRRVIERFRAEVVDRLERAIRLGGGDVPVAQLEDHGCGVGDWTLAYARIAARVSGFDINPQFIARARAEASRAGLAGRVRFEVGALADAVVTPGTDVVCMGGCLQYVDDRTLVELIGRVRDGLRPGGVLYVRVTARNPLEPVSHSRVGFYRSREWYDALFAAHGFAVRDFAFTHEMLLRAAGASLGRRIWPALRLVNVARRKGEYCNWFLTRG